MARENGSRLPPGRSGFELTGAVSPFPSPFPIPAARWHRASAFSRGLCPGLGAGWLAVANLFSSPLSGAEFRLKSCPRSQPPVTAPLVWLQTSHAYQGGHGKNKTKKTSAGCWDSWVSLPAVSGCGKLWEMQRFSSRESCPDAGGTSFGDLFLQMSLPAFISSVGKGGIIPCFVPAFPIQTSWPGCCPLRTGLMPAVQLLICNPE